ncbi:lysophospholipid acyltransferase family protein [Sandarakinorhabdus sp.]|uniref:lysophospholipid acyltransferase family protein n=1 Tax=Sandarakinorhabdus sp. TaxID=1916663 RepID=UPI003567D984
MIQRRPPSVRRLAAARTAIGAVVTAAAIVPAELLLRALTLRNRPYLPIWFHRGLARSLGVRIVTHGQPARRECVLYVANHVSWSDIPVLGARIEASFVAKSEVAGWGPVGWFANFAHTVYVARDRRSAAADQRNAIARRLNGGGSLILFPEGTNSDGTGVLPFKSALFSVAGDVPGLIIQPVTLAYTRVNGLPVTRRQLPDLAWVGDTELGPHARGFIGLGRVTAEILFHDPIDPADYPDRKALARHCHGVIAAGYRRLMRGG